MYYSQYPRKYLVLAPNLFEYKGGEQVYNAFLLQTLQSIDPEAKYEVLLESDRYVWWYSQFLPNTYFRGFGHIPRWWRRVAFIWQILWHCLREPPRLIVACHVRYGFLCGLLQKCFRIRYWLVVRGWEFCHWQRFERYFTLCQATQILATSYYLRSRLLQQPYLHPDRVTVLPNLVDGSQFRIADKPTYLQQRYYLQPEQPVILTVRDPQHPYHRNCDRILQAIAILRQDLPTVRYIFVGSTPQMQRVNRIARHLGIRDCVTLLDAHATKEVSDRYNLCDILALPNLAANGSLFCLEALACGKPVLVGARDGAADFLAGGQLGCLVDPEDPHAIADSLRSYLQHTYPNEMLYQPHYLRERVLARFAPHRFHQTLKELVLAVPATKPPLKKLKFE